MGRLVSSYGASVRGLVHERNGTPNEDAWLRAAGSFGSLVVVCDGMGSKPQAQLGARAAYPREAVARWAKIDGAPTVYLAHLIEVLWRLLIYPCEPKDAATTCLIALARRTGDWVVGGVGDGLLAVRTGKAPISRLIRDPQEDFGNETHALGTCPGPKAWTLSVLPPTHLERLVVLATDRVADDLIPENLDGFCEWIVDGFQDFDPTMRWRRLIAELRAWPTPKHLDDKTIVVLRVSAESSKGIE